MIDFNTRHNRLVWFDIPVADLDRAIAFYAAVLGIEVTKEQYEGVAFAVLAHESGNGGCLVPKPAEVSGSQGILVYLNVDGRIRGAVRETEAKGGKVLQGIHSIGPHGVRAIVLDSEGNRLALHATKDI